jgi:hypothetical protein
VVTLAIVSLLSGPCAAIASIREATNEPHSHAHVHRTWHNHATVHAGDDARSEKLPHHPSTSDPGGSFGLRVASGIGSVVQKPETAPAHFFYTVCSIEPILAHDVRIIRHWVEQSVWHQTSPPIYLATQRFRD